MIGAKDSTEASGITLRTTIHYDGCPLQAVDWSVQCRVAVFNVRLHYFQEQLMRVVSYFTNRFLWALTRSDPYEEFAPPMAKRRMTPHEVNTIKDLKQPDLGMDLEIEVLKSSLQVAERPYLTEKTMELEIESIKITQREEVVTGRHANLKQLAMKLTRMLFEMQGASLLYFDAASTPPQRQDVSSTFNVDFTLIYPSYSDVLEQISSSLLDKSSEIIVRLHPTVKLAVAQELYTFVMRCQALNFGYYDSYGSELDFSRVNEIFQSKENLLYMRTKIEIANELLVTLQQEGKELVEIKLRNAERSRPTAPPDGRQPTQSREMVRVDQYLDGQMKVQVQMGIPTLLQPADSEQESKPGAPGGSSGPHPFLPAALVGKLLLVGTESDPHLVCAPGRSSGSNADFENVETEALSSPPPESAAHGGSKKQTKPGKLQLKVAWAADGQQQIDCKVDRVKVFIRPNCFLRIGHFFGYGYPEFDMTCEDRPNSYETDFEKLPIM